MSSDSEEDALDDLVFDEDGSDQENEIDEDILGALEEDLANEASEADDVSVQLCWDSLLTISWFKCCYVRVLTLIWLFFAVI